MKYKKLVITMLLLAGVTALQATAQDYNVGDTFTDALKSGGSGPEMVVVPEGIVVMGGGIQGADNLGVVKITDELAFSTTEITNAQYRQFLTATQSGKLRQFPEGNDEYPVTGVSFDEAEAFLSWLSRETGHHYRLPSSSEWEFAARAGTTTAYHWGDSVGENRANCLNCKAGFEGKVAPVKNFKPNAWGLYDASGNAWEWVKDCIDSNSAPPDNGMPKLFGNCDLRELRGGSAQSDAWSIRLSVRASALRSERMNDVGFRVVMVIPD